ncbi:SLATT domain-containing protein [Undibacterium sp. SXout11W]|uniref:SLATT domain-containing protein n=1 Tax=Undibacterium sp. SXout11W TaxID=3413050 RepID=UPI003BF2106A
MSSKHSSSYQPPANQRELVLAWLRRARESQMAHYEMANLLSTRGRWLGVPVILITTVIGTSVFASLSSVEISSGAKIVVGTLSAIAAVLSSLQTFFKYSERSEKHRATAARYGAIRRKLEILYAEHTETAEKHYLDTLREELDRISDESPHVPVSVFERIQKNIFYTGEASSVRQS